MIAAVRTLSNSASLKELPVGEGGKLIIISIDSEDQSAASKAVSELQSQGIEKVDVVIANAGISYTYEPVAQLKFETLKNHVDVNAYGPFFLFQAVLPLLEKASKPKFVAIGTPVASIGGMESRPYPMAGYGMSKVIMHYMVKKIHTEHENLIAFVVDPGFVQTDMGNFGARKFGMEKAFTTIDDSVKFITTTVRNTSHYRGPPLTLSGRRVHEGKDFWPLC